MNSPTRNIVLSDIDQDNDLDILVTNRGYVNEICLNDGNGYFNQVLFLVQNQTQQLMLRQLI